ncbi:conserved Plasmodium protein, unknown function [Plasmodium chabaudi adami]|uniref:Mitochondrial import receptor subunit TOM7 n=1 Tax=Plasmodium chabaudi adami TaxID=5826 RepID=A0A1D3LIZ6_PLACE|nr:conserved Plasmodium protein, unknown function [Plasmodium chabaudi adami]
MKGKRSGALAKRFNDMTYFVAVKVCDYIIRPFLCYGFTPLIFGYGLYHNNEFTANPFKFIPKILIG